VRVNSRAVLGVVVVAAGMAAMCRRDSSRCKAIVTAPYRWVMIAKGPPHGAPI
jgi:hypothetical protein